MRSFVTKLSERAGMFAPDETSGTVAKRSTGGLMLRCAAMAAVVLVQLSLLPAAKAASTGTWTPSTNGGSSTAAGISVTMSGVSSTNLVPASDTFNTTNYWVNPHGASVAGSPSLMVNPSPFGTSQTVTITFGKAVTNPVLHIDRLGGAVGANSTTTNWTLSSFTATGGTVTVSRLGGDNEFVVVGNSFYRTLSTSISGSECTATTSGSTCGSVQYVGTGITSLTFTVSWRNGNNGTTGDGLEFVASIPDTTVIIKKQSVNATGTFSFTGTNGVTATSLNTALANPQTSATFTVTNQTLPITITETAVPNFPLTAASCVDQTSTAVASSLSGGTLTIASAAYKNGQTITCTFTNTAQADMSMSLAGLPTSASIGVPYSGSFTCTAGASPLLQAVGATCSVTGLPAGVTVGACTPVPPATVAAGGTIVCPVSGTPTAIGSSTVNGTTGATNDNNAANNTAVTTITTTGANMTPDLTALPATASIGVPYTGTITCTNSATATASALAATCSVSGLPAGVTVGTCTPTPPATVAAGASISCSVSGTPTAVGSATVSVATGATNDTNGGTTAGGDNTATQAITTTASDMQPDVTGLPTTASIGVAYVGTLTCTNSATATASALAASCSVSGLPPGVTVGTCTPSTPATVAAGASISCPVSGTPTAVGATTLTATTGATNDINGGAGSGGNNSTTAVITTTGSDMQPDVTGLPTTASIGVPYSGTLTCTNTSTATASATAASCSVSGLPPGVTVGACTPTPPATVAAGASISCPVSGTPTAVGATTLTATTGATNDINGGAGTGGNNSTTAVINTTGANMTPDLTGLPATATVGTPYTGTIACTNSATATASATAASCLVSGLPPGVTVGACTPTPPATVAAGASISCPVSGTPTAQGSTTVTVTTGATNDTNGGTSAGGDNTATQAISTTGSDMTPDVSGLPTTASIGVPYTGTLTCTNSSTATASATAASCSVSGLPPGVTVGPCTPTPPATVAAGASISCPVSGTPTAVAITTLTATTGATNDSNGGTGTGGNNTTMAAITTTGADMEPDLSGLPTTATVGTPYTGTIKCTNSATATASAAAATCAISGLPTGVTVGTCTPTPPATVAAGASISCTVSGTPTTSATSNVNVTSGATNDTNGGTTSGGNNSATQPITTTGSDMTVSLSGLPTTGGVGQPYSGSYTCTNVSPTAISATAASCSIAGLPAGLTPSCSPAPPTTVAANAAITCSVTGTPTASGTSSVTGTTGATNDGNSANDTAAATIAVGTPALSIAKATTSTTYSAPGVPVPYTFRVTNAGTVTIVSPVTVSDSRIASISCPALPGGGLLAGAFITCSGTYITTQADVDAGSIVNTASATSGTTTSPPDIHTLTATQSPALTVVKDTITTSFSATGVVVPYTFTVTNSGNVTLTSAITVSDTKIASVSCPSIGSGLAPGASITCTGSYTTTQADIDAGGVANTATARSGPTTSPPDTHTLTANITHSLVLTKSALPTTFAAPGVVISYSYVVRNNGNATIVSPATISVSDNKIATVSCPALPPAGLAPNATMTCTATHTTTQADVDAGSITNIASATDGMATSPPVSATVTAPQTPAMTIAKSTTATTYTTVGQVIPYSFRVTNTGNITLTSAITVSDSRIASVTCPSIGSGLAPAAFMTCTGSYTITQADLNAGSVDNTASANSGTTSSPPDTHSLSATQTRALSVVKASTTTSFAATGVVIPYSYQVTNAGNVTLTSAVTVADNKIASVSCPALPPGGLIPGASITCTGSYTTVQADLNAGGVTNIASASSGAITSPTATVTVPAMQTRALTVDKTANAAAITTVGQSVVYSYKVTNTGNVTLTSAVTVSDNKIASVSCPALPPGGLLPAAFITCSASYTVTQADLDAGGVTNIATASSGPTTSPTATLTVPSTLSPALSIIKSTTSPSFTSAGTLLSYSYTVTNTGNATLTSAVTVSDNKIASVSCPSIGSGLAPAAFITCTGTYTTTQADVDAGGVTNIASASSGATTSPTTSLTITSTQTPALSLVKATTATTYTTAGATVPYTYTVTNAGNTTLTAAVTVTDSKITPVACPALPPGGLVPGASVVCNASYTVTQADIDGGNIVNLAQAKSGPTTSPTVTFDLRGTQDPKLTITKASITTAITTAGQVVPYSYTATNTGNVTLTVPVTISDNKIASVSCPSIGAGLAPGASITCTASYTVTQADIDSGSVVNTAVGSSGDTATTITSNTTALTIPVTQTPSLSLVKSAPSSPYTSVGQVVAYSFAVTNSGNVTITTPITIADDKIASVSCPALPPSGLAPTTSIICTGSYTVTQADLDGGSVVNTATGKSGPTISTPPQVHTQTAGQTRALSLVKASSSTSYATVGAVVSYTYTVRNTGNVTVPSTATISVTDDKIASVSCPAVPPTGLAPNATLTCTASHSITQADIDAGSIVNNATATDGTATSNISTVTVPAVKSPALTLAKATTTTSFAAPGVAVPYTFTVTNAGNTTLTSAVTVADNRIASVSCPALPPGGLAPGSFITCNGTYTTTQADLNAGSVVNTATATSGPTSSPPALHTLPAAQTRALTIAKSASPTTFTATGVTIAYSYIVTNAGNVTIPFGTTVSVSDNKIASVSCPAVPGAGLAPGASLTCTASHVTTQADLDAGSLTNNATATDGTVTSPSTSATVTATQSPNLSIVKATTATTYSTVGTVIPYTFTATNTGNVTLTSAVTVTDNRIASVSCPALPPAGLAPTASIVCNGSYTITQTDVDNGSVVNTAFAKSGTTTSTPPVVHTLNGAQTRALTLTKSTTTTSFATVGVVIPYSYRVTNSGNVTITNAITIADDKIASVSCPALPPAGLAPGAFVTCTASYTTTQADIDAGKVTNIASATSGTTTSPTATATVNAAQSPALTMLKSSTTTSFTTTGTVIPYSYRVTNAGNTTVTAAITVTDDKIAAVTCPALPPGGLAPAAFITCTGSYTTTQADVDAGAVTNIASAKSGPTTSPISTLTINAVQTRALTIAKSSTVTTFGATGIVIPYSYRVTNSGNVTVTTLITIADDKIASVSCPALPPGGLAPAAFITCTGNYTTVQADIDAGKVTNIASATSGPTTSPTATLTINAAQAPALTIAKSSTITAFTAAGTVIPYSYRVTNSGNTTLTAAITVTDNKIASVTCPALPPGGLAPGAFITCSGSYTTTQADVDAGAVTNIASAKSGPTTSPNATLTINATQTRALTIAKSSTVTSFATVGAVIPYSYRVTNSGNVTFTTPITVADDRIASVSCPALPPGGLAPASFITCTANYTTVQADIDAGKVTNIASATSGPTTSPTATVTINATQTPALTIAKSSTTTAFTAASTVIPYSYRVTNSGNTTLTAAIAVTDDKIASVTCPALPPAGLAPAAFMTCTGSYTTTQADVDAGFVTNIASAKSGAVTSPNATLTINATQTRALTIAKSSTTTSFATVGTVIPYSYRVTNSGNVTVTTLITVADDKIAAVSCPALPPGGLAPAASITCTANYTTVQADVDAGRITNIATATSGPTTSPTATVTINATQAPALTIAKSSTSSAFTSAGTVIPYSYRVTNSGNTTLTAAITVTDDKISAVTCPALPPGGLAPTAFITCSGSYTTTQADVDAGRIINIASAKSGATTSPTATLTINAMQTPALTVAKSTTTTAFNAVGTVIAYSYRVTNSGNTTLTAVVTVADDKIASVSCPALPPGGLAPAAFITCTGSYTTTQADLDAGKVTNIASATSGTATSPPVTVTVNATQTPALAIVKSSTTTAFAAVGTVIPYSYTVTNAGNTTLTAAIVVTDDKIAAVTCPALPPAGLAPAAFITCVGSYTTTQADLDAGRVINIASAKSGPTTSPTTTLTITATQTPALTVVKSSTTTTFAAVGTVIPYSYKVTNTGNTTLTVAITVADDKIASVTCPALPVGGLAPASFITCTGSYTTTQADLDAGEVTNIATAKSGPTTSPVVSVTVVATQTPALVLVKSTTTTVFSAVGTVIPYSYTVTNSGNVTATATITVTDDKIASVTCPALPAGGLVPGASITCTGFYTTTQADLDAGKVTNIATAKTGPVVSPAVSVTVTATQTSALTVVKAATVTTYAAVGDLIPYTYKVTNTGNTTLTAAVTVADDKIASVTCPALPVGGLAPGAFITCSGTYAVTQADINTGTVTNVATATSGPTTSPAVSVTVTGQQRPDFVITETTLTPVVIDNGDGTFTATFTIVLTNTGNVDLADVKLIDDYGGALTNGAAVTDASIRSIVSSRRGPLSTANPNFTGTAGDPNILSGPGEYLAVNESITTIVSFRFTPGTNPSGSSFDNPVTATTIFNRDTPLATSATRGAVAAVTFAASKSLIVSKTTPKTDIVKGELIPYTITVRNTDTIVRTNLTVIDRIPAGFTYKPGSATLNGVPATPTINGHQLAFAKVSIAPNTPLVLKLMLIAGAGIGAGEFTNEAWVLDANGAVGSNVGKATVRMVGDPTFDCTDIIGRVFDDANRNGVQDEGERGIANVRVVTVRGQIITTDSEGRYHIACADIPDSDRGTNFILKLDVRSLPTGYRMTTENPRVIRITAGKMSKINFGAAAGRVARLDLSADAFEAGSTTLKPQWAERLGPVVDALAKEQATLRIAYRRAAGESAPLGGQRIKAVQAAIDQAWARAGSPYRLSVETEVYDKPRL